MMIFLCIAALVLAVVAVWFNDWSPRTSRNEMDAVGDFVDGVAPVKRESAFEVVPTDQSGSNTL